jgi:hypothetical protein
VLTEYKAFINKTQTDLKTIGGSKKSRQKVQSAISDARFNYNFVKDGHLPHNIKYGLHLLNKSAKVLESAMKKINKSYTIASLGSISKENSCLTFCHGKAFTPEVVNYKDSELPHELHIVDMELNCSACHSLETHGETKINQSVCSDCHD